MMDMGQNPQLGIEPLRESRLETLNDFASSDGRGTKEHARPYPGQRTIWLAFYDAHWREAPLYVVETKSGSMGRISPRLVR